MSLRSFSHNTIIYSIGTIALRFTSFLLIPLYTHYLSKENFGLLQTLLFTIQVLITFNDVGMRSALIRFFSEYETRNKLNVLLGSSISINLIAGFILIVIALVIPDSLISNLFNTETSSNLLSLTVLVALSQTLSLNILSYFRAKEMSKIYMIISLAAAIFLIFSVTLFLVVLELGIEGVLYAQILSFGLMWLLILFWITLKHGLKLKFDTLSKLFVFGSPLIFAMAGDLVINTVGIYFLGIFRNLEEVAIYTLAFKVAQISIMAVVGPFQMAYEPYVFRNKNAKDLAQNISRIINHISLIYIFISFAILFVFRDLISLIAPPDYANSYYLIFLILPGLGFTIFSYIGQSLLHLENKTRVTGSLVVFSTIISLVLSYFCIKIFGIYGFIFSINFYIILNSMMLYFFGNKILKINIDYFRISIALLIGIILFIIVYALSHYNNFIYYPIVLLVFTLILIVLFKSKFFTISEKSLMLSFFNK